MEAHTLHNENWQVLLSLLPTYWEKLAVRTGAIGRQFKGFHSAEALLRTLLLHIAHGYSLRETTVRARESGLAQISDVALLKRLRRSGEWFKALCHALLKETSITLPQEISGINLRIVDGTIVKEPGKTGSQWRVHYSIQLPSLQCDYFELTGVRGTGAGESFKKIPLLKNDCIMGDRGFSTAQGIGYVVSCGGFVVVRLNTASLPLYTLQGARFDLVKRLQQMDEAGVLGQWRVKLGRKEGGWVESRVCVVRKSEVAARRAIEKIKRKAKREKIHVKAETMVYAKYIIVLTTLPEERFSAAQVLEWYRVRWQIELVFKRLKSLASLGHLPKQDEESSRAWLYGKLLLGLLTEKLMRHASAISPWGYDVSRWCSEESVA